MVLLFIPLLLVFFIPPEIFAQNLQPFPKEEYFKAGVMNIVKEGQRDNQGYKSYFQILKRGLKTVHKKEKQSLLKTGTNHRLQKANLSVTARK